jgi:hypothetical protein
LDGWQPCVSSNFQLEYIRTFNQSTLLSSWSFKTVRYFGVRLDEVKKTGVVVLRPREVADDSCSESESDEE